MNPVVPGRILAVLAAGGLLFTSAGGARETTGPEYDASGALIRPEGYHEWVFVGASLGLSYRDAPDAGPQEFHHVYLRPESYDAFVRTGRFPDRTVLVLELHEAAQKAAPARHGLFEGRRLAVEAAVKDARLPDGWGYFSFEDGSRPTARAAPREACFECHRRNAAVDNVFVQFYPVLRDARH